MIFNSTQKEQSIFHRLLFFLIVVGTLVPSIGIVILGFFIVIDWTETLIYSTLDTIVSYTFSYGFTWLWTLYAAALFVPPWHGKKLYFSRVARFTLLISVCYVSFIIVPVVMVILSMSLNPDGFPFER